MLGCLSDFKENYILKMLGCLSDFMILSVILDTMNRHSDMIHEPAFWNYYDASMTRKELVDIICPIKFCKCWDASVILKETTFSKCWDVSMIIYDLECNYYNASMTPKELIDIICPINIASVWMPRWPIWYLCLGFEIIMMPRWPERNCWIFFVP